MSKTLIIITSPKDEYETFWGFGKSPTTHLEIGLHDKVLFIKRHSTTQLFDEFCPEIIQEAGTRPVDEIGILIHLINGDKEANSIEKGLSDETHARLKFCRWYSREQKTFWDGTKQENSLPYNAFRAAIKNGAGQVEAFDRVWDFFLWDPVLEAKLELLQDILNDKSPEEKVLTVLRQGLPTFDDEFADFKKLSGDDLFTPQFQAAFERLRDALEVD
jgi:hypothetical protein